MSFCIERGEHESITWSNYYTYKFKCSQYLERIDDLSSMSSYSYNDIKQIVVDDLVHQFRVSLNSIVFGDPAGKDYVENLEKIKKIKYERFKI